MAAPTPSASADDAWLLQVLRKENNRAMLRALENALSAFIADAAKQSLPFPPKGAFFRKVTRAVAARYALECHVEPRGPGDASDDAALMRLVLVKTPSSAVPPVRLAQLLRAADPLPDGAAAAPVAAPPAPPPPPPLQPWGPDVETAALGAGTGAGAGAGLAEAEFVPRPSSVLRRPSSDGSFRPGGVRGASGGAAAAGPGAVKNVTEEEYETARARIFQKAEVPAANGVAVAGEGTSSREPGADGCAASVATLRVAEGPAVNGSIGFGRRQGQRSMGDAASIQPSPAQDCASAAQGSRRNGQVRSTNQMGDSARRAGDAAAMQADHLDPDFDRRYSKWQAQPSALPVHPMYSSQGGAPPLMQQHQDFAYQSMLRQHAMRQSHGVTGGTVPAADHRFGAHAHPSGYHVPHNPHFGNIFTHHSGMQQQPGSNVASAQTFPVPAPSLQEQQFQPLWLPSHTPQGQSWRGQCTIEPHVARSSGVLRPAGGGVVDQPRNLSSTQAQYGLNSLADFPSLSDVQGASAAPKP